MISGSCGGAGGDPAPGTVTQAVGVQSSRIVIDAVITLGTTMTSLTASFGAVDVGASVSGIGIPANTTITAVVDAQTVTLSAAATNGVGLLVTVVDH